ncbi:hypothetical protein [Bacillus sp. OK048]|uniref:hypothetical protein n=1 Tax=Bacillus sp. OK048 TaxID=1882761 RepID=UPI00088CC9A4|nr:hypothetical protein [Bacillus sp. OK048]SDM18249.1 hypothetical protein SAMN05443253_102203 [Bacillus sp. OK048]
MDGKYLASNTGPLKVIGEGKVFITINDLLNTDRFKMVELAAYTIRGSESRIVSINCLFKKEGEHDSVLFYRSFDFYKRHGMVDDDLKLTAEHGIGFGDFDIYNFTQLRDFYREHSKVPVAEIS